MTDHVAKLKGREVSTLGVTPDHAKEMFGHKGRRYMAVVECAVDGKHDTKKKTADLVVEVFEVAEHGSDLDKHLRDLARVVYQNRGVADGQESIDGLTPSLDDAIAAGTAHAPHPFVPVDASQDNPICDACGVVEDQNPAHAAHDNPQEPGPYDDPFAVT